MAEAATSVPTSRRSRITPERQAELYRAVLDLLREVGYDALTMDAVAARTRSSKATLYRQWGGKAELVVKALRHDKPAPSEGIDTGTVRGDLHLMARREDDRGMERHTALMRGVAMAAYNHPDLREAFKAQLVEPEMDAFKGILQRGIDRGEIPADRPALDFLAPLLVGAFATHALLDDQPLTRAYLTSYMDAVILPALGVPTT